MSGFSVHASSSAPMSENLPPMVSKSVTFNSKCWAGEGLRSVRGSLGGPGTVGSRWNQGDRDSKPDHGPEITGFAEFPRNSML